ncbi:MAG: hypothetical protein GF310_02025, partial [candidate division Zixibacteria bacterium]|nr:hypothetical protein [candidate division Zixibacteria bacterium]
MLHNFIKTVLFLFGILMPIIAATIAIGQEGSDYLDSLPTNLELKEESPQEYRLTTIWHNRDLHGNADAKFVITGKYARGLDGDSVQWNDVSIEVFSDPSEPESDTAHYEFMEGFRYKSPEDIARFDFFQDF